jgi:hypothetical protein
VLTEQEAECESSSLWRQPQLLIGSYCAGAVKQQTQLGCTSEALPDTPIWHLIVKDSPIVTLRVVGFSATIGRRLKPTVGWEVSFIRLGSSTKSRGLGDEAVPSESLNGIGVDALFYFPTRLVDVFLEAGGAALLGTVHSPQQNSRTATFSDLNVSKFAVATGVGVQRKFRQRESNGWVARAQWDAFVGHGLSGLASVGMIFSF